MARIKENSYYEKRYKDMTIKELKAQIRYKTNQVNIALYDKPELHDKFAVQQTVKKLQATGAKGNTDVRSVLFQKLHDQQRNESNRQNDTDQNQILFLHQKLKLERQQSQHDHTCRKQSDRNTAEGGGDRILVYIIVLELCVKRHRQHKADAHCDRGDDCLKEGMLGIVDTNAKHCTVDGKLDEISTAIVIQQVVCCKVKRLNHSKDHQDEDHRLQVRSLNKQEMIDGPGDQRGKQHHCRGAKAKGKRSFGRALVFQHRTRSEEVKQRIVVGKDTCKKDAKNNLNIHYQLSSFSSVSSK